MSDFASAAMVRVLAQGMRELGLDPHPQLPRDAGRLARVDLDLKRALVHSALAQGGFGCLAQLGCGVCALAGEPTHRALATAREAADLLERWGRLERYVHSRHRVVVDDVRESAAGGAAALRHVPLGDAPAPLAAEDLVVLGVLAGLLQSLGYEAVAATAGSATVLPQPDLAALDDALARGTTGAWTLTWRGARTTQPPQAAVARARSSAQRGGPDGHDVPPRPAPLLASAPGSPLLQAVVSRLQADVMRPPGLAAVAQSLGRPVRSLQRALASEGWSISTLTGELRCRAAAQWLLHTRAPLAEVGFVCGYADQSHFTRDFRDRVGLTPAAYRASFGEGVGGEA